MSRILYYFLIGCLVLLGLVCTVFAQDETPTEQPDSVMTLEAMLAGSVEQAEFAAIRAEAAAEAVQKNADLAFNLLGLFEAIGLVITVVGGFIGVVGFWRITSAQGALADAREEFNKQFADQKEQLQQLQKSLNDAANVRSQEFEKLQEKWESAAEKRGEITTQALQAMEDDAIRRGKRTQQALLAQAYLPLGELQYKAQDYTGAIKNYETALELHPDNPVIRYRIGYVYTQKGELEQAQIHFREALNQSDDFAPALAGLGFALRRVGEKLEDRIQQKTVMNEAEGLLLKALGIAHNMVDEDGESWWGVLGGLYRRRGQIEDAIDAYKKATTVTPSSSYGFGNLAWLYMKKNRLPEMLKTYAKVEELAAAESTADINNFWGHADLIVSRYVLDKYELAAEKLERAIQIAPIESPYMLEALQETLEEIAEFFEDKDSTKVLKIKEAIKRIQDEREARIISLQKLQVDPSESK